MSQENLIWLIYDDTFCWVMLCEWVSGSVYMWKFVYNYEIR